MNEAYYSEGYSYTEKGQLCLKTYSGVVTREEAYTYEENGRGALLGATSEKFLTEYDYDGLGRLNKKEISVKNFETEALVDTKMVTYNDGTRSLDGVDGLSWESAAGNTLSTSYAYDNKGNISEIEENEILAVKYTYDDRNRLSREENILLGKDYDITYDTNGNILTKTITNRTNNATETLTYTYDTDGKMTSYNGESCVYDNVGRPTTYRGQTATWNKRKLTSLGTATFTYDAIGRLQEKNGVRLYYNAKGQIVKTSNGVEYYYDESGVLGCTYNGASYVFRKDL